MSWKWIIVLIIWHEIPKHTLLYNSHTIITPTTLCQWTCSNNIEVKDQVGYEERYYNYFLIEKITSRVLELEVGVFLKSWEGGNNFIINKFRKGGLG